MPSPGTSHQNNTGRRQYRAQLLYAAIGLELRRMRDDAGKTRAEVAKACGVAVSTLEGLEDGTSFNMLLLVDVVTFLDATLDGAVPVDWDQL
jgi:transcriptional regulator with XRE-family HTH domain